ncbi:hypothetical protein CI109_100742 [Kwoniella shandongensis]|uniref:NmrA-like domain-containing protein n=1 Tax=Kwoniella shandongensis TaxID=1734106 RepID=A0A5M6BRM4_9TREE|nr:uncharacterized protein CI109_007422 [Kwoniella shandongensis]KAA5524245.1 hypothetical protein CI109_007422 [Kwoniella shandongensis]
MKKILVVGSTGNQGGAVVKALVQHNSNNTTSAPIQIFALTRDASSDKAQALFTLPDVKVVQGDFNDADTLSRDVFDKEGPFGAMFGVTISSMDEDEEVKQGINLVNLAVKHGVKHFVFSSEDMSGFHPHPVPQSFDTKRQIEDHIRKIPPDTITWTILRPSFFYECFYWPAFGEVLLSMYEDKHPLGQVSVADVGRAAAQCLLDPEQFNGKTINLTGDYSYVRDILKALEEEKGIKYESREKEHLMIPPVLQVVLEFFNEHSVEGRPEETKIYFPFVKDFKTAITSVCRRALRLGMKDYPDYKDQTAIVGGEMVKILITGATGSQGGATVRALVAHNAKSSTISPVEIYALTRNATSEKAQALSKLANVKVVQGDLNDVGSLSKEVFEREGPFDGALLVTDSMLPDSGEVKQGKDFADLSAKHGVRHLIFTAVDQSGLAVNPVPHFETKRQIEEHIRTLPLSKWTILRPSGFCENFTWPGYGEILYNLYNDTQKYSQIAVADIGRAVSEVFLDTEGKFASKTINLTGSALYPDELFKILEEEKGIKYQRKNTAELNVFPELQRAFDFLNEYGYEGTPEETKKYFPWVMDFRAWLRTRDNL